MDRDDLEFVSGVLAPTLQATMFLASSAAANGSLRETDAKGLSECFALIAARIEMADVLPGSLTTTLHALSIQLGKLGSPPGT